MVRVLGIGGDVWRCRCVECVRCVEMQVYGVCEMCGDVWIDDIL